MSIEQEHEEQTEQDRREEYARHLRTIRDRYGSAMSAEDKKACREALGGLYLADRERAWRQAGAVFHCLGQVEEALRELREGRPPLSLPAVVDDVFQEYFLKLVKSLERSDESSLAKVNLDHPFAFFHRCMWNCIAAKLSKETVKFGLTGMTMNSLRDAGVPECVLSRLEPMKSGKQLSRTQFEREATKLLDKDEWAAFHALVLQYAEQKTVKEYPSSYGEPDGKTVGVTPEPPARADSDPEMQMMSQEQEQIILGALHKLTGREGQVMQLLVDGLCPSQVAEQLNVSLNGVYVATSKGRSKLAKELDLPEQQEG